LLFAGRLDVQKGVSRLQLLAQRLSALRPAVEMTVLGASVLQRELVHFPAWVQQLPPETDVGRLAAAFGRHDVLLLLSRWEGVPLALLDAMSHGMVPVATRVGSVDELVSESEGVLLDPEGSDESIADAAFGAVESLLQHPERLAELGVAGARRAWSYRWDDVAQIIIEIAEGR
jgi:glycosyltransferase involved in cell wall biosynthesis